MFCDSCGAAIQAGQTYCTKCGKEIIGPVTAGSSRAAQHAQLVAIFWIAYSAFSLVGGVVLMIIANTIFGRMHRFGGFEPGMPPPPVFLHPLLTFIALLLLVKAGAGIIAGAGLLQRQPWARTLAIVLGCISLINIPFGTALGIYTLWVLLSPNAEAEYQGVRRV
jgi:predicted nucleic acid-binding Zn ribbon protein